MLDSVAAVGKPFALVSQAFGGGENWERAPTPGVSWNLGWYTGRTRREGVHVGCGGRGYELSWLSV